jgi:NADH-quinone oxidoreductase subunit N
MNWNALLPELILPFGILLLFFLDLLLDKRYFRLLNALGGFVPIFAFISLFFVEVPAKTFFDTFSVGPFELFGKGLLYILSSLSLFALYDYFFEEELSLRRGSLSGAPFYLGLSFFMSSDNLLTLLFSVELSSISIYILIALLRGDYNSKESAFKYL